MKKKISEPPNIKAIFPVVRLLAIASEQDRDILARTLWGEARGEGVVGMSAIASVILNRMKYSASCLALKNKPAWWGGPDSTSICLHPKQFSCWNLDDPNRALITELAADSPELKPARLIVDMLFKGLLKDVTFGATHYHAGNVKPAWAKNCRPIVTIEHHLFYKLQENKL